jgi:hypothetical protein
MDCFNNVQCTMYILRLSDGEMVTRLRDDLWNMKIQPLRSQMKTKWTDGSRSYGK